MENCFISSCKIIVFKPTVSGTYTFTSSSSADTYGRLYDANMSSLTSDDDTAGSRQFKMTYTCTVCDRTKTEVIDYGFNVTLDENDKVLYKKQNTHNVNINIRRVFP